MQQDEFERMRAAVYAVAAVSGRVGPDVLDRDHGLRALLFAVFAAGAAKATACGCAAERDRVSGHTAPPLASTMAGMTMP